MRSAAGVFWAIIVTVGVLCIESEGAERGGRRLLQVNLERISEIPDLLQTDPKGGLPGGGRWYCGPVAISNSLAWFSDNGYENLMSKLGDREKSQFEMVRVLGSRQYMDTIEGVGTDAYGVLRGVSRYIEHKGYRYLSLQYQGWGRHPRRFGTGTAIPEPVWIKKGLLGNSAVWLNAGWYKYDEVTNQYQRIGEHWLTLVGYGMDKDGNVDQDVLIVHDPAPRAGKYPAHNYVKLELIKNGKLMGKVFGLPRDAKGYYILGGDMRVKKAANVGILDGAVVLKMKKIIKSK